MFAKPVAFGLVAAASLAAVAGGAYVASRQGLPASRPAAFERPAESPAPSPAPQVAAAPEVPARPPAAPSLGNETGDPRFVVPAPPAEPSRRVTVPVKPQPSRPSAAPPEAGAAEPGSPDAATVPARPVEADQAVQKPSTGVAAAAGLVPAADVPPVALPQAPTQKERVLEEIVVPAQAVLGLSLETALSSEQARVEDRVEARVTRDVMVDGKVAIPAGTRAIGSVTVVERGGKLKERAKLAFRFHTLELPDKTEVAVSTEAVYREGENIARQNSARIGGAAVGGALIGAILGGGKGAAIGGGIGAAGGTAAAMARDRQNVVLRPGMPLSVRTEAPVTVTVER